MAAAILSAGKLLSVVIGLVNVGIDGFGALQKVTKVIEARRAAGQPITNADLQDAIGDDDAARLALEQAIANAPGG
jgi:hypothetical protein